MKIIISLLVAFFTVNQAFAGTVASTPVTQIDNIVVSVNAGVTVRVKGQADTAPLKCDKSYPYVILPQDSEAGRRMTSALITVTATKQKIKIWVNGCVQSGQYTYPKISQMQLM